MKLPIVKLMLFLLLFAGVFVTLETTKKGWQFPKASDNNAQNQFPAKQTPSITPVNLPLSYPIFGQVQTKAGKGISDSSVTLQIEKDNMKSASLSTATDKDGRFVLDLGNVKKEDGASFAFSEEGYETLVFSFTTPDNQKGTLKTSLLEATNTQPISFVVPQTPSTTSIPSVCSKNPDLDQNGVVNTPDYNLLIANYSLADTHTSKASTEANQTTGDINCDGKVNALDISLLITHFNEPIK